MSDPIGSAIQSVRKQQSLTQEELARKAHVAYSTLAKIERGAIHDPSISTVAALAAALNTSVDELLHILPNVPKRAQNGSGDIEFLLCDVNGVLVRFFQRAFVSMAEALHRDINQVETAFWHYNAAVNKGEMTTKQFNDAVGKRLGVSGVDWEKEYMNAIEPVAAMHDCIREVIKTMPVGLLTNIFPDFVQPMIKSGLLPDLEYATIVDSSQVGAIKPEPEIYKIAEDMSGYSGQQILFIDDSRTNLMEAERHNWRVLWFDDYRPEESVQRVKQALAPHMAKK